MRTWSVSGTALALCTRSSSLSIRTSTSIAGRVLLLVGQRRPAPAVREHLLQAPGHEGRDELLDVAAERGDLLDSARGDEADLRARHHVDGLDVRREVPVQLVHLELVLEVGDHPEPLHDRAGVPAA